MFFLLSECSGKLCNLLKSLHFKQNEVVKMDKKPSEESSYEDFFSKFNFVNYSDGMEEFSEK